jgi:hypothetical protein
MVRSQLLVLLAFALVPMMACDEALDAAVDAVSEDNPEAENAVDAMQQGSLETALLAALVDPVDLTTDIAGLVAAAEAASATTFTPAGCVNALIAADNVGFTFDNCAGPYGLTGISGVATLTFTDTTAGVVSLRFAGAGLQINGATLGIGLQGSATTDTTSSLRTYTLTTAGAGATRDGVPVTRAGNFTAAVDTGCLVMQGAWTLTIQTAAKVASFRNFKRCSDACPDSGSLVWAGAELTADDIAGGAEGLALTFRSGSSTVAWVDGDAKAGITQLDCAP